MADLFDPARAFLYGRFVNAVYAMYDNNPGVLRPPQPADFSQGYRLTAWIQMQDFLIGETPPVFYGLIAHSIQNPNQAVLAIRGTRSSAEWIDNLNAIGMERFPVADCGNVALGFERIYETIEVVNLRRVTPRVRLARLSMWGIFQRRLLLI